MTMQDRDDRSRRQDAGASPVARAKTADGPRDAAPATNGGVPPIPSDNIRLNAGGMAFQSWFVRLPEGVTAQHLNDEPTIWRLVQSNRNVALRKFDEVRIVDYAESWIVDATVSFADHVSAILAGPRITRLPQRALAIFEDETYRVKWFGSGWGVERKKDSQIMCGGRTFHTAAIAEVELRRLYASRTVG
jgi:hypothetical protein